MIAYRFDNDGGDRVWEFRKLWQRTGIRKKKEYGKFNVKWQQVIEDRHVFVSFSVKSIEVTGITTIWKLQRKTAVNVVIFDKRY